MPTSSEGHQSLADMIKLIRCQAIKETSPMVPGNPYPATVADRAHACRARGGLQFLCDEMFSLYARGVRHKFWDSELHYEQHETTFGIISRYVDAHDDYFFRSPEVGLTSAMLPMHPMVRKRISQLKKGEPFAYRCCQLNCGKTARIQLPWAMDVLCKGCEHDCCFMCLDTEDEFPELEFLSLEEEKAPAEVTKKRRVCGPDDDESGIAKGVASMSIHRRC